MYEFRDGLGAEKGKLEVKEKETFAAQYKLVGLEQELQTLHQQLRTMTDERDALKASFQEEEIARIAAEGMIPLPASDSQDEFSSPRKKRLKTSQHGHTASQTSVPPLQDTPANDLEELRWDLGNERHLRQKAEELVDFMKLECQLKSCHCRMAEHKGTSYTFDPQFDAIVAATARSLNVPNPTRPASRSKQPERPPSRSAKPHKQPDRPRHHKNHHPGPGPAADPADAPLIMFSPVARPARPATKPARHQHHKSAPSSPAPRPAPQHALGPPPLDPTPLAESPSVLSLAESLDKPPSRGRGAAPAPATAAGPALQRPPSRSHAPPLVHAHSSSRILAATTTTTVPLAGEPRTPHAGGPAFPFSPGMTKTREEALQSIEKWRRGRSRSVVINGTPRRQVEGLGTGTGKRDYSAPVGNGNAA